MLMAFPLPYFTHFMYIADVLRTMPSKAIELASYDIYKRLLSCKDPSTGQRRVPGAAASTVAGALAGARACPNHSLPGHIVASSLAPKSLLCPVVCVYCLSSFHFTAVPCIAISAACQAFNWVIAKS